jgi:signal transduction histidine kinase
MTLRRRIGRFYAGVGAVSLGLCGVVAVAGVQFVRSGNDAVQRWEPATARTQRVLTDFVEQDTAVRGYALSRTGAFVEAYRTARAEEAHDLGRLRTLVRSDDNLVAQVGRLAAASDEWQQQVAEPAVGAGGSDPAASAPVSDWARELFDAVRTRAQDLIRAVDGKAADARNSRRDYLIAFVIALALTAVTLVVAGFLFWRELRRWVLVPIERLGRETRLVAGGDTYRQITVEGPVEFTDLGRDVEAMRLQIAGQLARAQEIQEELRIQGAELARSNDDLQQFAYVASHDLSEPLRKVANFCQLLERQYGDQLDDRARQYIDFAVDGAKRMQRLISDLLALSRVGRTTEQFVPVALDEALDSALATLADPLQEAGA